MSLDEGTLVVYHGSRPVYRGDLAFVRDSKIGDDDRRHYLLDLVCYQGTDCEDENYIDTFGSIEAIRSEFTVVELPAVPEPMQPGNYINGSYPWRRSADGSWDSWLPGGTWELRGRTEDEDMAGAIYIGPLPKP
jgi:hypothetical protein